MAAYVSEVKIYGPGQTMSHIWTVKNSCLRRYGTGVPLISPVFGTVTEAMWVIMLYPNGPFDGCDSHLALYLRPYHVNESIGKYSELRYCISLLNAAHGRIFFKKTIRLRPEDIRDVTGDQHFISKADYINYVQDNKLIICVDIYFGDKADTSTQSDTVDDDVLPFFPVLNGTLSKDLGSMFKDRKYGDTVIEVNGEEFIVCKEILQARSPVFAAMFEHDTKERQENRVQISDAAPKCVREMLTYIYTGQSPGLQDKAIFVLPIAEKYQLDELKIMCEGVLSTKLKNENAINMLNMADLYRAHRLKKCIITFICNHSAYFVDPPIWKNIILVSLTKNLILELTTALFASMR